MYAIRIAIECQYVAASTFLKRCCIGYGERSVLSDISKQARIECHRKGSRQFGKIVVIYVVFALIIK